MGEHNLKLKLFTKEALIGRVFLGNKPVISQVHSYDILVINTHPFFASDLCNNKDIILILVIT